MAYKFKHLAKGGTVGSGAQVFRQYTEQSTPVVEPFLTFSSPDSFTLSASKNWDGVMQYSTDKVNWISWTGSAVNSVSDGSNYYIYLRGIGNTKMPGSVLFPCLSINGNNVSLSGNIENLLDYNSVRLGIHPIMADKCFEYLFSNGNESNTFTAITDISKLELPAVILSSYCYRFMFTNNVNLSKPVKILPALTLTQNCYMAMYAGTSITEPSQMLATVLAYRCCDSMYYKCTLLNKLPKLPILNLADECYNGMFSGCTSIKISDTQDSEYVNEYRIPETGVGIDATDTLLNMFNNTSGTFTGTPVINTSYYTSNDVV